MTTWSRSLQIAPAGSGLKQVLRNVRAATTDSTPINEVDPVVKFSLVRRVDPLRQDGFDILLEQAVAPQVEDKLQEE